MAYPKEQWHLDKRVPVAIIFAIFMRTAGAIWWASSVQSRVLSNERRIARLTDSSEDLRAAVHEQAIQLGRIEEQITGLRSDIQRMLNALERGR